MVIRCNFKHYDGQAFLNDLLASDIHDTTTIPAVELALDHFWRSFNLMVNPYAPFKKVRVKNRSNPLFSGEISSLLKERDNGLLPDIPGSLSFF